MTTRIGAALRVGVIGAGQMGANHCRVYGGLKGVELIGVLDVDGARASAVAAANDCGTFASLDELLGKVDAVSVAAPSSFHAEIGEMLLDHGIHCLVEKPLATTDAECQRLVDASRRTGAVLLVGHIERFNPAVSQLKEILADDHAVLALDARRMSAVSSRLVDVDVVLDLMVHDLDIVLDVVDLPVVDVVARGVTLPDSPGPDYVTAMLHFEGGCLATFTASRITQNQVRSLEVTTDQRFFTVDYSAQELLIYRQGRIGELSKREMPDGRYVLDVGTERVFVRRVEPLAEELSHFVRAIRDEVPPRVTGEAARNALRLVWEIQRQVAQGAHS
jgi:predicted dehydrogenase